MSGDGEDTPLSPLRRRGVAASPSPVFARTPLSAGSPEALAASPVGRPIPGAADITPAARLRAGEPRTPASGGSPPQTPAQSGAAIGATPHVGATPGTYGRRVHRGFLSTTPGASPGSPARSDAGQTGDPFMDFEGKHFIYGTDINEAEVTRAFHRFINNFRVAEVAGDQPYYLKQLQKIWEDGPTSKVFKLLISGTHLAEFSRPLYTNLVNFPTEVIPIFDREIEVMARLHLRVEPGELESCQVQVGELEPRDQRNLRCMNPTTDIERLVSTKGIVIRCSDLTPDMHSGLFRCSGCKHEEVVSLTHWLIEEPTLCSTCNKRQTFQIVHNECTFGDRQLLKIQETPESVPQGETPQHIVVHCYDDLVDQVRPGDRVEVTGIYRANVFRPIANWSKCSSVYRTHVDAISITAETKTRIDAPVDDRALSLNGGPKRLSEEPDLDPDLFSEDDIMWHRKIRALAAEKDSSGKQTVVDKLVQSFAPSIFEEDDVKKGLLVQLFGGTPKAPSQATRGRCRPEINTLLCGDPSTAKSQLLQYAYKLAPRAVYTSGKGSSAVGLTASINRDPVTKDLVLESGALVLADRGMCCIDEFDKMDERARAILHEAMEQQTVSVAKAGIVCSLNARASILASANPIGSSYDARKSVVDNINLPKNLMTRFDLIWLMLDKKNRDMDKSLAEFLVSMYSVSGARKRTTPPIDPEMFRRYVSFARRFVFPRLTDEAHDKLLEAYMELRNQGTSRETITATPRILESLIRLSEAHAKMVLREEVLKEDVEEAVRLLRAATYAAVVDPETGLIDMEQLIAGAGAGRRRRQKEIDTLLEEVLLAKDTNGDGVSRDEVIRTMNEQIGARKEKLITDSEFNAAVSRLEDEGRCRRRGGKIELRV